MSYPPSNIPSHELFAKLTSVPRPHRVVDFPRVDPETHKPLMQVALTILSQQETMAVAAAAEKTARKLLKDSVPASGDKSRGYDDLYNHASAIEVLFRACRHPDDIKRTFFPSKDVIAEVLTTDEIAILLNDYFTVQLELGPIVGSLSNTEIDAWIQKLAEGGSGSQYFLSSLSWEALKGLLIAMASQLWSFKMDTASPTSLQENEMQSDQPEKVQKISEHQDAS